MSALTAERLRECLNYDRATGIFAWAVTRGGRRAGTIAGNPDCDGYIKIGIDGKDYRAHRLAWLYVYGEWPPGDLDHKDTVRHHNWIDNLRPATNSQNQHNSRRCRANTSGLKGAHYHRRDRAWHAQIHKDGRNIHLGYFPTAEAAHAAYVKAAIELFGEFARAA